MKSPKRSKATAAQEFMSVCGASEEAGLVEMAFTAPQPPKEVRKIARYVLTL